ncbi:carbonic anhydrase [Planosporangium sp. 12N6]|uniref:carbonic anhydrase n=1 Tax=Planosporangium spinosum TaxID=3402278 RepID=UPI003CF27988
MQSLIDHARVFHQRIASRSEQREEFARLASGQQPQALFITCSDSRVIPAMIMSARPGELFELRTAGSMVPPPSGHPSGEAATIEYAIEVLGVTDVVVCGHSHCGAVRALTEDADLTATPALRTWLAHAAPPGISAAGTSTITRAVQHNVLVQRERLASYPCVRRRLSAGAAHRIRLHGWFYEIDSGAVLAHRPEARAFLPL